MSVLEAIAIGAASGAVAAVAYLAFALGTHTQMLIDHSRRIEVLEHNYSAIEGALDTLKALIVNGGA